MAQGERAVERVHVGIDKARGDDCTLHVDGTAPPGHETPDGVVIAQPGDPAVFDQDRGRPAGAQFQRCAVTHS
jgi:hypothetical protein